MSDPLVPFREDDYYYLRQLKSLPSFSDGMTKLMKSIIDENLVDLPGKFDGLTMNEDAYLVFDGVRYAYNRHSFTQAIDRIRPAGVSMAPYLLECPAALRHVNYAVWHASRYERGDVKSDTILVRTHKMNDVPTIRAIPGLGYAPVDDPIILGALADKFGSDAKFGSYRGDRLSRYYVYWPTTRPVTKLGDDVYAGIKIVNSEVRTSSIYIQPIVHVNDSGASFAIPRAKKEVGIRHVGEAERHMTSRFEDAAELIEPFMERMELSYNDMYMSHFTSAEQLAQAVTDAYGLQDGLLHHLIYTFNDRDATRYEVACEIASYGTTARNGLEDAEARQEAAGDIIYRGWGRATRALKPVED
jgi:hypothetical protein